MAQKLNPQTANNKLRRDSGKIIKAYFDGSIATLADKYGTMPVTAELAATARTRFMSEQGLRSMDPFAMAKPGRTRSGPSAVASNTRYSGSFRCEAGPSSLCGSSSGTTPRP